MFRYIKEYRFYIILFMFVLIPIISIDTVNRAPREYRFYDRVVIAITSPVQSLISWSLDTGVSIYQNYIFLWKTRRENSILLEENRKLLTTVVNLQEAKLENQRFRKLFDFKEQFKLNGVLARVIAKDVSTEFRAIRINRGENDGIQKNMAVLHHDGIVGRIWRTTPDTADIVTILDLLSAVDVIDARTRAHGIVEGMTDEVCQLKFSLRTDDIQPGDMLLTSGLGGVFPKGIPVGTVSKVFKKSFGITQNIEVRPSADFSKLEEVFVAKEISNAPGHSQDSP